jgi:predicted GH43/DUF377 family glycosyl hydrolase
MGRTLYITPSGKIFCLKEGTYKAKLEKINDVLFKLQINEKTIYLPSSSGNLYFNNNSKECEIEIKDGTYVEITGNNEKYQIADIGKIEDDVFYIGIKRLEVIDGDEVPILSPETRALGGYFYVGTNGPLATFNPALYGELELIREVYNLPTFVGMISLYKNGKKIKSILKPWDLNTLAGVEDPRITTIDGKYVLFVTEYNFKTIRTGVYISEDFDKWTRVSYVYFPEFKDYKIINKALHLASVYIDGKPIVYKKDGYFGLYGESSALVLIKSKDLKKWEYKDFVIEKNLCWWNSTLVETGALIRVKDGYVLILNGRDNKRNYHIGYAVLDENFEIVEVSENPFISPTKPWEKGGIAANVTFFSNGIAFGNNVKIIYGCADQRVGKIEINKKIRNTLEISWKELVTIFSD